MKASPSTLVAGAGERDITPPPGFPTGGHGPAGEVARGYWSKLHARAFYFRERQGSGKAVVLVSCDLFAFPLGLHREIWKRISHDAAGAGLAEGDIVITATHTHHGPGNFVTAQIYNDFGSKYSGFSRHLFDFLAKQIGSAIQDAIASAQEAELRLHFGTVSDSYDNQFILNRSPATFMLNWDRRHVLEELGAGLPDEACQQARRAGEPEDGWDLPGCPRLRAADRRMTVLDILGKGNRLGALVFFAVHPTVLMHSAPLNNSDFVGLALDDLERDGTHGIVAFFNGAEGDITPRRMYRDILETRERSAQFRQAVETVWGSPPLESLEPRIAVHSKLIDIGTSQGRSCKGEVAIADKPEFGVAAVGGAELDRTQLYDLGWREGVRGRALAGQGSKQPALDDSILHKIKLTQLLAPPKHFPLLWPVVYASIGDLALAAIPVEMSTTQGLRIREQFGKPDGRFHILGLANEYGSYVASASEYEAQDYMAASTVWGPHEGEFLECTLADLAAQAPGAAYSVPAKAFRPGPKPSPGPFGPKFVGELRELPDEGLEEILLNAKHSPERHLPFFVWDEPTPNLDAEFDAAGKRRVRVITEAGIPVSDAENDFVKMLTKAPSGNQEHTLRWSAIWLAPLWAAYTDRYRFEVSLDGENWSVISKPFSVAANATDQPAPAAIDSAFPSRPIEKLK